MVDTAPSLVRSARPFSLVVALASCGLGAWLGVGQGASSLGVILAVLCAGLLLQLGVNLINDQTDLHLLRGRDPTTARHRAAIRLSYRIGLVCLALAIGIGLWLVALRGWGLLVIGIIGVVGAFAYTTEPLRYKRRGLGVPLVCWLLIPLPLLVPLARSLNAPCTHLCRLGPGASCYFLLWHTRSRFSPNISLRALCGVARRLWARCFGP